MSKAVYRYSSIARPLEPAYATNRAMLILLPAIGLGLAAIAWLMHEAGPGGIAAAGLGGLLATFLVWALGREVDPDRNSAAFIALGLTVLALVAGVTPAIWTLAFALMAARIVTRTVGLPARPTDVILVVALAALAVFRDGQIMAGAIGALAIALDVRFDPRRSLYLLPALISLAFTVWALLDDGAGPVATLAPALQTLDALQIAGWLMLLATGAVLILTCPVPQARCDATGEPLARGRIRGGLAIVWLVAVGSISGGSAGLIAALPVWMVIAGAAAARLASRPAKTRPG